MDISVDVHRDWVRDGADLVRIGEQYALPVRFEATITPRSVEFPACRLRVVVENGRPVCEGLELKRQPAGPPVSGDALRRVPVAAYVARAVDEVGYWVVPADPPPTVTFDGEAVPLPSIPLDDENVAVPMGGIGRTAEYRAVTRAPRRQGRVTDEKLREVADVYRRANATGHPTKAVMEEWHVERATASRWVRRAREAGFLGAARPRMAGEF